MSKSNISQFTSTVTTASPVIKGTLPRGEVANHLLEIARLRALTENDRDHWVVTQRVLELVADGKVIPPEVLAYLSESKGKTPSQLEEARERRADRMVIAGGVVAVIVTVGLFIAFPWQMIALTVVVGAIAKITNII